MKNSLNQPSENRALLKMCLFFIGGLIFCLAVGFGLSLLEHHAKASTSEATTDSTLNQVFIRPPSDQVALDASGSGQPAVSHRTSFGSEIKLAAVTPLDQTPQTLQTLESSGWQRVASFPSATPWDNLGMNDSASFQFFERQGYLWIRVAEGVESFQLFVNNHQLETREMTAGGLYQVDISDFTVNGENNLVIAPVRPRDLTEAVTVYVPYPLVLDQTGGDKNAATSIEQANSGAASTDQAATAKTSAAGRILNQTALTATGLKSESFALLDQILSAEVAAGFPGAQLAVVKDGQLIYENSWGVKNTALTGDSDNANGENLVDRSTLFDLGGLTGLAAVAYAVQNLADQGKLDLDATVPSLLGDEFFEQTILIDYTDEDYAHPSLATEKTWKQNLTVRQLLEHQSGFPVGPKYYLEYYDAEKQELSSDVKNLLYAGPAQTWRQICRTPLVRQPGTKTVVSDLDALLLGLIVEKVSGQNLDEFCKTTFWEPLGLNISYNPTQPGQIRENSAPATRATKSDVAATELSGNTREGTVTFPGVRTDVIQGEVHDEMSYYCMDGVAGHAGVFASATDLAVLGSVMLTGGYDRLRFFSADTISQFTSAHDADGRYGLLWRRQGGDNGFAYYFGTQAPDRTFGGISWTGCLLMIDPVNNLVIAYNTNAINSGLVDSSVDINDFNGNWYLAKSLGFVPQLIYQGLNASSANYAVDTSHPRATVNDYRAVESAIVTNFLSSSERLIREEFEPKYGPVGELSAAHTNANVNSDATLNSDANIDAITSADVDTDIDADAGLVPAPVRNYRALQSVLDWYYAGAKG